MHHHVKFNCESNKLTNGRSVGWKTNGKEMENEWKKWKRRTAFLSWKRGFWGGVSFEGKREKGEGE
jgi:hypothetical protein